MTTTRHEQRMASLQKADSVRLARAQLKRDLKARVVSVEDVLLNPPSWLSTWPIRELLLAAPQWGHSRVDWLLWETRVPPTRAVAALTDGQRKAILNGLAT